MHSLVRGKVFGIDCKVRDCLMLTVSFLCRVLSRVVGQLYGTQRGVVLEINILVGLFDFSLRDVLLYSSHVFKGIDRI